MCVLTRPVTSIGKIRGERACLVGCLPVGAGAIIVVGEHFVVVDIHPGEQGAA